MQLVISFRFNSKRARGIWKQFQWQWQWQWHPLSPSFLCQNWCQDFFVVFYETINIQCSIGHCMHLFSQHFLKKKWHIRSYCIHCQYVVIFVYCNVKSIETGMYNLINCGHKKINFMGFKERSLIKQQLRFLLHQGGFQLEFVSISRVN